MIYNRHERRHQSRSAERHRGVSCCSYNAFTLHWFSNHKLVRFALLFNLSYDASSPTFLRGQNVVVDAAVMAEREMKRAKATELQRILLQQVHNNHFPWFLPFRLPQLGFHGDVGLVLVTTNVLMGVQWYDPSPSCLSEALYCNKNVHINVFSYTAKIAEIWSTDLWFLWSRVNG